MKPKNPWNVTAAEPRIEITKAAFSVSTEALGLQSECGNHMKRRVDVRAVMSAGSLILPLLYSLYRDAGAFVVLVTLGPMLFFMMYAGFISTIIVTPSNTIVDRHIMQHIIQQQQPTMGNIPSHQNN